MLCLSKSTIPDQRRQSRQAAVLACAAIFFGALQLLPLLARAQAKAGRYSDAKYGYSLVVPPGWVRNAELRRPYVAFLGPVVRDYRANFSIYTEPSANKSLAQVVKVARQTIAGAKTLQLKSSSRTRLAATPAVELRSLVTEAGSEPSVVRQILAVHKGNSYTLTFTTRPADLKAMTPVFNRVLSSFRWLK
jgi:hypothetical protein